MPKLKTSGKSITDIARDVRREVREVAQSINRVQTPAYYDEVVGEFCPAGCDVQQDIAQGRGLEVTSTPTIFVNGVQARLADRLLTPQEFRWALEIELARAK